MAAEAENTPVVPPVPGPSRAAHTLARPTEPRGETRPWGRVDEAGVVSVRTADDQWRVVGEYPDGTPEEALAYFERKFADLVGEVTLLENRKRSGGASAAQLRSTAQSVRDRLDGASAVGDLAALTARMDALLAGLEEATAAESQAAREAVDAAVAERTALVEQMEALAARDPQGVVWKQASAEVDRLFAAWQAAQQAGPRLPKSAATRLWKRFRDARGVIDRHRREFYAQLDDEHRAARERKKALITRAEALAPRGEDGIPAYRDLLDEWKAAGRTGKRHDDALWARFKAAGDVLYGARSERENAEAVASEEKIVQRQALLEEAAPLVDEKDLVAARATLTDIQRRWDEIGRIFPRDKERALDERLRKIEQNVRTREEADWKRNDPEKTARSDDMTRQLHEAIAKLEQQLAAAEAAGDTAAAAHARESLTTRRAWLQAVEG